MDISKITLLAAMIEALKLSMMEQLPDEESKIKFQDSFKAHTAKVFEREINFLFKNHPDELLEASKLLQDLLKP